MKQNSPKTTKWNAPMMSAPAGGAHRFGAYTARRRLEEVPT